MEKREKRKKKSERCACVCVLRVCVLLTEVVVVLGGEMERVHEAAGRLCVLLCELVLRTKVLEHLLEHLADHLRWRRVSVKPSRMRRWICRLAMFMI